MKRTFNISKGANEVISHLAELFGVEEDDVVDTLCYPHMIEILDLPAPAQIMYSDYMKHCQFIRDTLSWKKRNEK